MAMGSHIFFGDSDLSHISLLEHTLTQRNLTHISLRHFYTPGIGKFNITIVNHYLHYCKFQFLPPLLPHRPPTRSNQSKPCRASIK